MIRNVFPMETTTYPTTRPALITTKNSIKIYGVLTAVALLAVVVMATTGHPVNTFMWVRGILLPLIAVALYRLDVAGSRRAFERVRGVATVLPIAIIGVDLIPGVCPLWYAVMQAVCMLPVIVVAVLSRRRPAFTK